MKTNLFFIIILTSFNIHSQDTIFVGEFGKDVVPRSEAKFYRIVKKDSLEKDVYHDHLYHLKDTLKSITSYTNYFSRKKERFNFRSFYPNGKIKTEIFFKKEKYDGTLVSYWENGRLKRKDLYNNGKFLEGTCWDETGKVVPYYALNIAPEYPGGMKAFHEYVLKGMDVKQIPHKSFGSQIKVSFYIEKDGSISNIELVSGADPVSNLMALKLVAEMPKWSPGIQDGVPVRVKRTLPMRLPERPQFLPTR